MAFAVSLSRHGDNVDLRSKSGEDLARYFPELVQRRAGVESDRLPARRRNRRAAAAKRFRSMICCSGFIPPRAGSRNSSQETPALFLAFDLLATTTDRKLAASPLHERRPALEAFAKSQFKSHPTFRLSPATHELRDRAEMARSNPAAVLDGVIAKRIDLPYQAGNRDGMQKIKKFRSADCVVGGFRYATNRSRTARSSARCCSASMTMRDFCIMSASPLRSSRRDKPALTSKARTADRAARLHRQRARRAEPMVDRASAKWCPLKPKLVIEICYDHFSGERFRHGTSILRWRPDKAPRQCSFDQLRQKVADPMKLLEMQLERYAAALDPWIFHLCGTTFPELRFAPSGLRIQRTHPVASADANSAAPFRRANAAIALWSYGTWRKVTRQPHRPSSRIA